MYIVEESFEKFSNENAMVFMDDYSLSINSTIQEII